MNEWQVKQQSTSEGLSNCLQEIVVYEKHKSILPLDYPLV